jgi:hypothetical protein
MTLRTWIRKLFASTPCTGRRPGDLKFAAPTIIVSNAKLLRLWRREGCFSPAVAWADSGRGASWHDPTPRQGESPAS